MDRCWESPISPPSIHPLHLAKDNFAKHKSHHVTPLLNKPLLLPQRLKDNVLPWRSFTIWPSLFLLPYILALFYSIIHSSQLPRKLCHFTAACWLSAPLQTCTLPPAVDTRLTLAYPPRFNTNVASFGKPLLTTLPGWAYFLSIRSSCSLLQEWTE